MTVCAAPDDSLLGVLEMAVSISACWANERICAADPDAPPSHCTASRLLVKSAMSAVSVSAHAVVHGQQLESAPAVGDDAAADAHCFITVVPLLGGRLAMEVNLSGDQPPDQLQSCMLSAVTDCPILKTLHEAQAQLDTADHACQIVICRHTECPCPAGGAHSVPPDTCRPDIPAAAATGASVDAAARHHQRLARCGTAPTCMRQVNMLPSGTSMTPHFEMVFLNTSFWTPLYEASSRNAQRQSAEHLMWDCVLCPGMSATPMYADRRAFCDWPPNVFNTMDGETSEVRSAMLPLYIHETAESLVHPCVSCM